MSNNMGNMSGMNNNSSAYQSGSGFYSNYAQHQSSYGAPNMNTSGKGNVGNIPAAYQPPVMPGYNAPTMGGGNALPTNQANGNRNNVNSAFDFLS
jgi:hypothetical protein